MGINPELAVHWLSTDFYLNKIFYKKHLVVSATYYYLCLTVLNYFTPDKNGK